MSWEQTSVPKPRRGPEPGLGQVTRRGVGGAPRIPAPEKPIPRTEVSRQARLAQHGTCVEHVKLDGLREPLCIRKGEDREAAIAAARELLP